MDALDSAEAGMNSLQLKVGILEGATFPDGKKIAPIAAVQEYGELIYHKARTQVIDFKQNENGSIRFSKKSSATLSMKANISAHVVWIPPRPFFRNAISKNEESWNEYIAAQSKKGVGIDVILSTLGERIVGDIQESISSLMEPPLKQSTLNNRKSRGNSSTKPLVDKGDMFRSIAFEVGEIEHSEPGE